jgi:predicted O-methyltransferase YrrM
MSTKYTLEQTIEIASSIPGWMTREEMSWLYRQVNILPQQSIIVEIGSFKGRSSLAMGLAMSLGSIMYSVDTFIGDPYDIEHACCNLYVEWIENIFKNAYRVPIVPLAVPSALAVTFFQDQSVDFCFIDGSHNYEDVTRDIDLWLPKVKTGKCISGHDYVDDCPGVIAAVDQHFKHICRIDKIWSIEKTEQNYA